MTSRRPAATDTTSADARARDQAIVELAVSGVPIMEIGRRYGAATVGRSTRLVRRALESRLPEIDLELQHRLDQARLDQLWSVWWTRAEAGDAVAALIILGIVEARRPLLADTTDEEDLHGEVGTPQANRPDLDPAPSTVHEPGTPLAEADPHPPDGRAMVTGTPQSSAEAILLLAQSPQRRADVVDSLLEGAASPDSLPRGPLP